MKKNQKYFLLGLLTLLGACGNGRKGSEQTAADIKVVRDTMIVTGKYMQTSAHTRNSAVTLELYDKKINRFTYVVISIIYDLATLAKEGNVLVVDREKDGTNVTKIVKNLTSQEIARKWAGKKK